VVDAKGEPGELRRRQLGIGELHEQVWGESITHWRVQFNGQEEEEEEERQCYDGGGRGLKHSEREEDIGGRKNDSFIAVDL